VAVWLVAVLGMLAVTTWARHQDAPASAGRTVAGMHHFQRVDAHLWRGSAPGAAGYRELAAMGVRTVVDLRAENLSARQLALPGEAGLHVVRMPIRDGQTPTEAQVEQFTGLVGSAGSPVFVHCGAGVGRTGSVTAAYLVRSGQETAGRAALGTVAVGPPSIEQVYYAANVGRDDSDQPPLLIRVISRVLDAPRRIKASL
jgi:protein tyrosine phosphatase (PTP) superfamily phosphohydrolase (DUF442 family)